MGRHKLKKLDLNRYVTEGKCAELQKLRNKGVDLNLRATDNCSLFVIAARLSYWNVVKCLIDCGADIYSFDDDYKWTFLHYSTRNSWMPAVQIFIDEQLNLEIKTARGETPLMIAAQWDNVEAIDELVKAGANINCCDVKRWTALHHSVSRNSMKVTEFLVEKNIDINAQNVKGYTALHLALKKRCDIEIIGYLLREGADCNIQNYKGKTAFNLLTGKEFLGAIRVGIEKGACVSSVDYYRLESLPLLKSIVLERVRYCTQAIINKYNNKDLPDLYKVRVAYDVLPPIERMKIRNGSGIVNEIERSVGHDIQVNSYCNLMTVQPLSLSMFCINSFLGHVQRSRVASNQTYPSGSRRGSKRKYLREHHSKKKYLKKL